jgi:predicted dehydrogenase
VALVGCGLAARELHGPSLRAIREVELVGVCDRDADRARRLAADFRVPDHYSDFDEMLRSLSPNVVHVLTPPESHAELAVAALEAGCDVLLEKPFVYRLAEAEWVIERARSTGRRFSVIHNELFTPSILELKERLARAEIGQVCSVHYLAGRRDQRFVPDPWYYRTRGGRLGETLPHALCLLVDLLEDAELIHATARRLGHTLTPETVSAEEAGPDELQVELWSPTRKALGTISYSLNSEIPTSVLVAGTTGNLLAHPFGGLTRLAAEPPRLKEELLETLPRVGGRLVRRLLRGRRAPRREPEPSVHAQIRAFVAALLEGGELPVTPDAAREVVRLWEEIVEAWEASARDQSR